MNRSTRRLCVLGTIPSDAHTWNLIYIEYLLTELGFRVKNLGNCTSPTALGDVVLRERPDLVVISTVNGHGGAQGRALLEELRVNVGEQLPPIVIGGRLTTCEANDLHAAHELLRDGYDRVFVGSSSVEDFRLYVRGTLDMKSAA